MHRVATVAVALTVVLAGCPAGPDLFDGETPTPTTTPTDPERQAIETAVSLLKTNERHFVAAANVSTNRSLSLTSGFVSDRFNRTAVVDRARQADAVLADAVAEANASERETIRNLRRVADAHVSLAYAVADAQTAVESARRARSLDVRENASAALAALNRTDRHLDAAIANVSAARETLNATNAAAVRPYNPVRVRFAREQLGPVASNLTRMRHAVDAYRSLARASLRVASGRDAIAAGNYTRAVAQARAANESLYAARTHIDRIDDDRLDPRLRRVERNFTTFANATAGFESMALGFRNLSAGNESLAAENYSAASSSFSAAAAHFGTAHDRFESVDAAALPTYNESELARLRSRTATLADTSRLAAAVANASAS